MSLYCMVTEVCSQAPATICSLCPVYGDRGVQSGPSHHLLPMSCVCVELQVGGTRAAGCRTELFYGAPFTNRHKRTSELKHTNRGSVHIGPELRHTNVQSYTVSDNGVLKPRPQQVRPIRNLPPFLLISAFHHFWTKCSDLDPVPTWPVTECKS